MKASQPGWTSVFSQHLLELGEQRQDIVAITAAMAGPTGLSAFAERFPDRFVDVGIAEQHALTSAAGMALGGLHPVVALYSTFLNRAFDQLLMDVALLGLPVTVVLDRSGITGSDGASHNGVWDLSMAAIIPGIRVAAPRDAVELVAQLDEAVAVEDGPTIVRFPKGSLPQELPAVDSLFDGVDILYYSADSDGDGSTTADDATERALEGLIVSVGPMAGEALEAARRLEAEGFVVTVVDPRWVLPVQPSLVALAAEHDVVVVIEDGVVRGGVGSAIETALSGSDVDVSVRHVAVPQQFLEHASRAEILEEFSINADGIVQAVYDWAEQE